MEAHQTSNLGVQSSSLCRDEIFFWIGRANETLDEENDTSIIAEDKTVLDNQRI